MATQNEMIQVIDPSTEELITEVPEGGEKAVNEAVARAKEAFESGVWSRKPASEKTKVLRRLGDLIEEHGDELAEIESRNTGMNAMQLRILVSTGAETVHYNAGMCTKLYGITNDIRMTGGIVGTKARFHAYTLKEPFPVAGLIVPWNGPLFMALVKSTSALAAGCSCVLKPASYTPLTALRLAELMREAGVPDDVFNVVTGRGSSTGAALVNHPDVNKVSFTGSVEVGKEIINASTGNLKKVTLELGGKSPVLIFDDADLSRAIMWASIGIFAGSGQGCVCGSRVYVQRGVYNQVVQGMADFAKSVILGGPQDEGAMFGPIISKSQLDKIMGFIDEAKAEGAEIVEGGYKLDRPGYFVRPTVVTNTRPDMRMVYEEIFGPVVAVIPFDEEEEAIAAANSTPYGLAGGVWTNDVSRAHRMASQIQSGMIWINCELVADPSMPFGGYKRSGWGLEFGMEGVDAFLQTKSVYTQIED